MRRVAIIGLILPVLLNCGCKQRVAQRKYRTVVVTTREIDIESGVVVVDSLDDKTGEVRQKSGRVTRETEFFINGISASFEDVRVGDRGKVTVYVSPDNPEEWIVTAVHIDREKSFMLEIPLPPFATSKPASQNNPTVPVAPDIE